MSTIVVHHLEKSRSLRILWLLEELGLAYDMKEYQRDPETWRAPATLKKIHPLGRSPLVEVDGNVMAESGAILESLLDRFDPDGTLRPAPDSADYQRYRFFLHYAEGSAMPPLLVRLIFQRLRDAKLAFPIRKVVQGIVKKVNDSYTTPEIKNHFDFIEQTLHDHTWFAGDTFSAADIQMSYPVEAGITRGNIGSAYPKTQAWIARIKARPAYQRAADKGGPAFPG